LHNRLRAMLLLLRNNFALAAASQLFVGIACCSTGGFRPAFFETEEFDLRNSFSSNIPDYRSVDLSRFAESSSPISHLLPPSVPFRDPDLSVDRQRTMQLLPGSNLPSNAPDPSMRLQGSQSTIISGGPGETVVLSLKNFVLSGDAVLTLQGSATTSFVINVTKQFSLSGNAQINLSGLQSTDVFFNIRGTGGPVSLSGNASLAGTLIANGRTVQLNGNSTINGAVSADRLRIIGSSRVIPPPSISSP
jgi:hypothetical protein